MFGLCSFPSSPSISSWCWSLEVDGRSRSMNNFFIIPNIASLIRRPTLFSIARASVYQSCRFACIGQAEIRPRCNQPIRLALMPTICFGLSVAFEHFSRSPSPDYLNTLSCADRIGRPMGPLLSQILRLVWQLLSQGLLPVAPSRTMVDPTSFLKGFVFDIYSSFCYFFASSLESDDVSSLETTNWVSVIRPTA
ncbi:hypothetical protein BJX99DRAFT_88653 [Aspergillus californicus]